MTAADIINLALLVVGCLFIVMSILMIVLLGVGLYRIRK